VRRNTIFNIILDGTAIFSSTTTKFLGIKIDHQLNWKQHINKLVLKLNKKCAVISKIRYKINTTVALKLYDTLILPHIFYCTIIWAAVSNSSKLRKIHLIQKRALRTVVQAHHRASSKPKFLKLKRLNIFDIYKTQVGSFMYANLHRLTPNLLPDYFHSNFYYHLRTTRHSFFLHIAYARTTIRQISLSIYALTFCNTLPRNITNLLSPDAFKYNIKHWLLQSLIANHFHTPNHLL